MPTSLNCPNCGAASSDGATACAYCGSTLVAVACPSCFSAMFVGAQFCPRCGAKAEQPREVDHATLRCPGCGGDMRHEQVGEVTMHQCGGCGTAWLAPENFTKLVTDREARGTVAASGANAAGLNKPKPFRVASTATRYVRCPVCNAMMNRVNFSDTSGVIIDTCASHGIWFERDELHAILSFVEQGGLARRRAELQQTGGRHYVREMRFDSEAGDAARREIKSLIVRLNEAGNASGRASWTDLLKVFFE